MITAPRGKNQPPPQATSEPQPKGSMKNYSKASQVKKSGTEDTFVLHVARRFGKEEDVKEELQKETNSKTKQHVYN